MSATSRPRLMSYRELQSSWIAEDSGGTISVMLPKSAVAYIADVCAKCGRTHGDWLFQAVLRQAARDADQLQHVVQHRRGAGRCHDVDLDAGAAATRDSRPCPPLPDPLAAPGTSGIITGTTPCGHTSPDEPRAWDVLNDSEFDLLVERDDLRAEIITRQEQIRVTEALLADVRDRISRRDAAAKARRP